MKAMAERGFGARNVNVNVFFKLSNFHFNLVRKQKSFINRNNIPEKSNEIRLHSRRKEKEQKAEQKFKNIF